MPDLEFPPGLLDYFATQEERHQRDIDECWPRLESDVAGFFDAHPDDPSLPKLMARLIRESAVAGFVCGARYGGAPGAKLPPDRVMLHSALETIRLMRGQAFHGFALFDAAVSGGKGKEGEGDD